MSAEDNSKATQTQCKKEGLLFKRKASAISASSPSHSSSSIAHKIAVESERYRKVQSLADKFEKLCNGYLKSKKWYKHFESWLWECRGGGVNTDAVLPDNENCTENRSLQRKLVQSGASDAEAIHMCKEIGNFSKRQSRLLQSMMASEECYNKDSNVKCLVGDGNVKLSYNNVHVEVNRWHYDKLHVLFEQHGGMVDEFDACVFVLLARYYSVQGGQPQGGGNQAAVPSRCMEVLVRCMGVRTECFASPLNCCMASSFSSCEDSGGAVPVKLSVSYCSLFPDTDEVFGSRGLFSSLQASKGGSYQANPPYEAASVRDMYHRMNIMLSESNANSVALQFIVIIPHWGMSPEERQGESKSCDRTMVELDREDVARVSAWNELATSRFLSKRLQLPKMSHAFHEGCQHVKTVGKVRPSVIDTDIFFLQTSAAATRWPVNSGVLEALRMAFDPAVPGSSVQAAILAIPPTGGTSPPGNDNLNTEGSDVVATPKKTMSVSSRRAERRKRVAALRKKARDDGVPEGSS
mmetsp:Transcript_17196/g.32378  ORF Transcript_17196/g.32378 Transcript_17196/m.32378 type:complete len:522 (+) Transcript_17196:89-1654(+)